MNSLSPDMRPTSIKEIHSLFVDAAMTFRGKGDRKLIGKPMFDEDIEMIASLDGLEAPMHALQAANMQARRQVVRGFLKALLPLRHARPELQFIHVTIINDDFATSDEHTRIDLVGIRNESRKTLSRIAPDFHGVVELQAFAKLKHPDGGKLLSPHTHSIVCGPGILHKAEEVAAHVNQWMRASVPGCDAMRVQLIGASELDLAIVAAYPLKLLDKMKTLYLNVAKGLANLHESEASDRYIRYFRMFQIFSMIGLDRMIFAGGNGRVIRRRALQDAYAWLSQRALKRKRAHSMAEIEAFWAEFMPRMGWGRFALPEIIIR